MASKILPYIVSLLIFFITFEIGSCYLAKKGSIPRDLPNYSLKEMNSTFWAEINPAFGRWHAPYSSYRHRKCFFEVEYTANSYGMRDRERDLKSDKPRTVMLGDSFVEGYGIPAEKRISNLLEQSRGKEHLNFGMTGYFGPTEYYLVYKTLAKNFSHDEVIVGLYPYNDFTDDDYEYSKRNPRYKPFFVGKYPNYELIYGAKKLKSLKPSFFRTLKTFFREFTYSYSMIEYIRYLFLLKTEKIMNSPSKETFAGYYDFNDEAWDRMRYALEKLIEEAKGKKLAIFLIPSLMDFKRYGQEGPSPLSKKMEQFAKEHSVVLIDFLPSLHETQNWKKYYNYPCDDHLNEEGQAFFSKHIQSKLTASVAQ